MDDGVIARAESPRGEVVLRRRAGDGEVELRVNGVFVMDTRETSSERVLAKVALAELGHARAPGSVDGLRVLVGGLGLGFTLREFARSTLVGEIVVAEIEPALVEWHRHGLVPDTAETLRDPRVRVDVVDVRDAVAAEQDGSLDVVALDVDNGPGFLVYDDNATLYGDDFLCRCRRALAPDGRIVVWSGHQAPDLYDALARVFASVDQHSIEVTLGSRLEHYYAYASPARPVEESPCPAH